MKESVLILCLISLVLNQRAEPKKIALTFDDSPRRATGYFNGMERAERLVNALQDHDVKEVIFFSNSGKLNSEGLKRLQYYNDANYTIANHGHNHLNFNTVPLDDYINDIVLADSLLSTFSNFKKFFRFPYLREGNTKEKRDGVRALLERYGYINGYITCNNYDWYIETLFQQAIRDRHKIDLNKMKQFYVNVLIESIEYYDKMAQNHLGYSPKHVLLLHEMDITALFIGDLISELRKRGWEIISPLDAYKDDIANFKANRIFKYNPGRIGEIARSKGQTKSLRHKNLDENYLKNRFNREVLNHQTN